MSGSGRCRHRLHRRSKHSVNGSCEGKRGTTKATTFENQKERLKFLMKTPGGQIAKMFGGWCIEFSRVGQGAQGGKLSEARYGWQRRHTSVGRLCLLLRWLLRLAGRPLPLLTLRGRLLCRHGGGGGRGGRLRGLAQSQPPSSGELALRLIAGTTVGLTGAKILYAWGTRSQG